MFFVIFLCRGKSDGSLDSVRERASTRKTAYLLGSQSRLTSSIFLRKIYIRSYNPFQAKI